MLFSFLAGEYCEYTRYILYAKHCLAPVHNVAFPYDLRERDLAAVDMTIRG